jgi:energy-coupling factor transporter ATP-binding protein EcfA2
MDPTTTLAIGFLVETAASYAAFQGADWLKENIPKLRKKPQNFKEEMLKYLLDALEDTLKNRWPTKDKTIIQKNFSESFTQSKIVYGDKTLQGVLQESVGLEVTEGDVEFFISCLVKRITDNEKFNKQYTLHLHLAIKEDTAVIRGIQEEKQTDRGGDRLSVKVFPEVSVHFFGREDALEKIYINFQKVSKVTVIGGAGSGKSQLVARYAYDHRSEYDCIWTVNAADSLNLERSYREFAVRTGFLLAESEDFVRVLNYVKLWLERNERFLFIYENAEGLSSKLADYLPRGYLGGHVWINTQDGQCNLSSARLDMAEFVFDGAGFLQKRLEDTKVAITSVEAQKLAKVLLNFPLALEHAAAYMTSKGETCDRYLALFESKDLSDVLADESVVLTLYEKLIAKTWQIAMDALESEGARVLFSLCAYCAPEDIPLSMFIEGCDRLPVVLQGVLLPDKRVMHNQFIGELTRYSLLSFRRDKLGDVLLSMHRLIQAVAWRKHAEDKDTRWLGYCLDLVCGVFRYDSDELSRVVFGQRVGHVLQIADHAVGVFSQCCQPKIDC